MKPHIKKSFIHVDDKIYNPIKLELFKKLLTYISIIATTLSILLLSKIYHDKVTTEVAELKSTIQQKTDTMEDYIMVDSYIDKAISDSNEINFVSEKVSQDKFLDHFTKTLSELAYFNKITTPMEVNITNINTSSNISPIKINITVSSKKDRRIIRLIDSIALNLHGFVRIQDIRLKKVGTEVRGTVTANWYTATQIKKACLNQKTLKIVPTKYPSSIEEKYRISIWNGAIIRTSI